MSKICDRNYAVGSMYSTIMMDGVDCCPSCKQPAICHGATIEQRALYWALADNTGSSSKAIANHMAGNPLGRFYAGPPSDADDRSRCIRLLEIVPEWIARLPEMVKYDAKPETGIVINSSGMSAYTNTWAQQIPLIMREGKF